MGGVIGRFGANVWVLAGSLSLGLSAVPLMVLISGIIGTELAPTPSLATLPLACLVIGTALSTLPAAHISRRFGRRFGGFTGFSCLLVGALGGIGATEWQSFASLLAGSVAMGAGMAFLQQFRFAAIESLADPADAGPAVSLIMLSGIVAAVIGPELGVWGHQWRDLQGYTGSFVLLAAVVVAAAAVFSRFKNPDSVAAAHSASGRPMSTIVKQPAFMIAVAASALGYGVMSFLMTSTPISMHSLHGHSVSTAKWVIQSHLLAMFLPSLFSGLLLRAIGAQKLLLIGCLLYLGVLVVALSGHQVVHYWWALVLLGVGWNFLFLTGTTLLPGAYRDNEKFRVQAVNDFAVFTMQAVASLTAGWVLIRYGWTVQIVVSFVPVSLLLLAAIWQLCRPAGRRPAGA